MLIGPPMKVTANKYVVAACPSMLHGTCLQVQVLHCHAKLAATYTQALQFCRFTSSSDVAWLSFHHHNMHPCLQLCWERCTATRLKPRHCNTQACVQVFGIRLTSHHCNMQACVQVCWKQCVGISISLKFCHCNKQACVQVCWEQCATGGQSQQAAGSG